MNKLFEKLNKHDILMVIKPGFDASGSISVVFKKSTSQGKVYNRSVSLPGFCLGKMEDSEIINVIESNLDQFYSEFLDFELNGRIRSDV